MMGKIDIGRQEDSFSSRWSWLLAFRDFTMEEEEEHELSGMISSSMYIFK